MEKKRINPIDTIIGNAGYICSIVEALHNAVYRAEFGKSEKEIVEPLMDLVADGERDRLEKLQQIFKSISNLSVDIGREGTKKYIMGE